MTAPGLVGVGARLIKRHAPLLVMLGTSLGMFAGTLVHRPLLSPTDYGQFALLLTVLSVGQLFGRLGAEHPLLRVATVGDAGTFQVPPKAAWSCLVGGLAFLIPAGLFCTIYFPPSVVVLLLFSLAIISATTVIGNLLRLGRQFTRAQMALGFWKIIPLFWWGGVILGGFWARLETLLLGVVLLGLLISILGYGWIHSYARFEGKADGYLALVISFFLSIGTAALLSYGERFVVLEAMQVEALGDYYLAVNLFVFPWVLLGSYIGFIRVVDYKTSGERLFRRDVRFTLIGGAILIAVYLLGWQPLLAVVPQIDPGVSWTLVPLFGLLALLRLGYGPLSAAMGALGSARTIVVANVATATATGFLLWLGVAYATRMLDVLIGVTLAWLVRGISFYFLSPFRTGESNSNRDSAPYVNPIS